MTPEYAAEQAAAELVKAHSSWPVEQAAKHVNIADGWTRLHTALANAPKEIEPFPTEMHIEVSEDRDPEQFKREMRFALGLCQECGKKVCRCEPPATSQPAEIGIYRERAHLVAYLATQHPSMIVMDADSETPGWPVIYITSPHGQLSWHISPDDLDLFPHVPHLDVDEAPIWDGHTSAEKYERLHRFITGRAELDAATPDF